MKKIVAFGASSSKNSINKELAKYAASRVPESTYEMIDLLDFEMPIYSVKVMDTLMPEVILKKLKNKSIDLKQILYKVIESDYAPQILFEASFEEEGVLKEYKVWIE